MIKRRESKEISIGNVKIGHNNPISVQSMCNTDTRDVNATLTQIEKMQERGCELVRLAVLNKDAASAIKEIVKIYHSLLNNTEYDTPIVSYSEFIDSENNYINSNKYIKWPRTN